MLRPFARWMPRLSLSQTGSRTLKAADRSLPSSVLISDPYTLFGCPRGTAMVVGSMNELASVRKSTGFLMNYQQQLAIDAIRRGIASLRPELSDLQFGTAEVGNRVILSAPNWPDIHVGVRGGISVQVPSYPETGKPGETALDAAIWGDRLLAKLQVRQRVSIASPVTASAISHGPEKSSDNSGPSVRSWRDCADYYLRGLWFPQDRHFVSAFSGRTITCEVVDELCRTYQVSRSFEGYGTGRYQAFADVLNAHCATQMTRANVVAIVSQALFDLANAYGKTLISALTKALWMMKQHPVAIYDKKARDGLSRCGLLPGEGDYRTYFGSWFAFYDRPETQTGIDDAVSWLPGCPGAQALLGGGKLQAEELEHFAKSEAFRNRIADMRLASLGGSQDFFG